MTSPPPPSKQSREEAFWISRQRKSRPAPTVRVVPLWCGMRNDNMITTSARNGLRKDTVATRFDVRDGSEEKVPSRLYVMPEFQSYVLRREHRHFVAPIFSYNGRYALEQGNTNPGTLNYVSWHPVFVGPQCGTSFISPLWRRDLEVVPRFLENLCTLA